MKICLNCGDRLLDSAKKCPSCGTKDKGFPIVDPKDKERIDKILASVPHPKSGTPQWQKNLNMVERPLKESFKIGLGGEEKAASLKAERKRVEQMERDGVVYCPKCHSTSLSANKKGFGVGKAAVGFLTVGPLGLVAGNAGAKNVEITCLNCGYRFKPGQK